MSGTGRGREKMLKKRRARRVGVGFERPLAWEPLCVSGNFLKGALITGKLQTAMLIS